MIMTNTARGNGVAALPGQTDLLPDAGEYEVRCSRCPDELAAMLDEKGADYIVVGAVLPARSGKELCRLMVDDSGMLSYPVALLKQARESVRQVTPLEQAAARALSASPLNESIRQMLELDPDTKGNCIVRNGLEIHPGRHEVKVQGKRVEFTATEFRMLCLFTQRNGWVVSRESIIEQIRGKGYPCTRRSVDVLIVGIRRKLGPLGNRIQTVRGVGYRYQEPIKD
jgi:two-component system, OmpR family, alkaline phosphatase synthesis response regulator PhoP